MQLHHSFCTNHFPANRLSTFLQTLNSCHHEFLRVIIMLFFLLHLSLVNGQVPVTAIVSDANPAPGELFGITLSTSQEIDFYSASAEVMFDNTVLEFVSAECSGLSSGGLAVAGLLGPGSAGASVTRVSALAVAAPGSFMILEFRVNESALAGSSIISFAGLTIHNSSGDPMETGVLSEISIDIDAGITNLQLLIPDPSQINEGENFMTEALLFSSGITDQERISCHVGISLANTDPSTWDENSWHEMEFDGTDGDDNMFFSADIGVTLTPGEWFIAVKGSLDGGLVFGGINGIWNTTSSPSGQLTVIARPPFRYTLAGWDFDAETFLTSQSVPDNRDVQIQLIGADPAGFMTGANGLAANSRGWNEGAGVKFWLIEISTSGFTDLELSSQQYGSGTGPRDFAVQYSLDGISWEMVDGGEIAVGTNWTSGKVEKLGLPPVLEDREKVFLRWVMTSDVSIGEGETGATGTSRIDNIAVTGINPHPELVTVFAGDANNDGVVNADDVLPLGMFWLTGGPPALIPGTYFGPRIIEQWIPPGATFADTNGDGIVDHKDLLAVGLNFGKLTGSEIKDTSMPLSVLDIDPVEQGRVHMIMLASEDVTALRGVSFSIGVSGVSDEMWEVGDLFPLFATDLPSSGMLSLGIPAGNKYEGAFAIKGMGADVHTRSLAGFELIIDDRWNMPFTVSLNRLSISTSTSAGKPIDGNLDMTISSSSGSPDGVPLSSTLLQNYPNPFSSVTSIPYRLGAATFVQIEITDIKGRVIDSPFAGFKTAGEYMLEYDGRHLPGGVYFCRMITTDGTLGVIKLFRVN